MQAIPWMDTALISKERIVYTAEQLQVPGLRMFGYHCANHAIPALPLHYHKDCFEFTYIAKGNLCFSVSGQTFPLSGGDLFLSFPNEAHDTATIPMSLHKMYWFQLDIGGDAGLFHLNAAASQDLLRMLKELPSHVVKLRGEDATRTLSSAFSLLSKPDALSRSQGSALLVFFLYSVITQASKLEFRLTPDIGRAVSYILEHLHEPIELDALAQVSLLSLPRFKQKFKLQMGTSPREFINFQKVEAAKARLREHCDITQIAMELGFSSSNYFSTVFRRFTDYSPTQYAALKQDCE